MISRERWLEKEKGMFGRGWEAAEATIVARRLVAEGHSSGGGISGGMGAGGLNAVGGGQPKFWEEFEYTADVRPASGATPFRATIGEPRNGMHFHTPDVGQVVRVKFHPKDQQVKFDHSDPVVFGKHGTD